MKKIIALTIIVVILLVGFIFLNPIAENTANTILDRIHPELKGSISSLDIDVSQGKASFAVNAELKDSGQKFLTAEHVVVDLEAGNLDNWRPGVSVEVKNIDLKISKELLQAAAKKTNESQTDAQSKEEDEKSSLPFLPKSFRMKDFNLQFVGDSSISGHIDLVDVNFDKESGKIKNISGEIAQNKQFLFIDQVAVAFNAQSLLEKLEPQAQVEASDVDFTMSQELMDEVKELPKPPGSQKNETAKKEGKDIDLSSILMSFKTNDVDVLLQDKGFNAGMDKLLLNLNSGKITISDIFASLANKKANFLDVETVEIKFDPKKLLSSKKPSIDIAVFEYHLKVSQDLLDHLKHMSKSNEKAKKEKLTLPIKISRILIAESRVSVLTFPGVGKQEYLSINEIFGSIHDLSAEPGTPLGSFAFNATFEGDSKTIANGRFDLAGDSPQWSADWKLLGFDLKKINDELRQRIPINYSEGVANAFGEVIKRDEAILGYVKPFLIDAKYMGNEREFKGVKHFLVEVVATITNWLFENDARNTVATKIPFIYKDGNLQTDATGAVFQAIEHGLLETDTVKRGVDKQLRLKQAQEEE